MTKQPTSPPADIPNHEAMGIDADSDEQDMAAAMGFSSFGMQDQNRPAKKRRFNSHADDAVVTTNPNLPPKPPRPALSGANSLPLHFRGSASHQAENSHLTFAEGGGSAETSGLNATQAGHPRNTHPPPSPRFKAGPGSEMKNPHWYLDYYDPTSNQNPWEQLEQSRSLLSVGPWLPSSRR